MILGPIAALAVTGCGSSGTTSKPSPDQSAASKPAATKQASTSSSGVEKVPVTLDEFAIKPTATKLRPGKVEFKVKNTGRTDHEFVVIDTSRPAAKLGKGPRVPEHGNIGETGDVKPGHAKTLVLHLRRGHYAVICNDPGHYMAGMHKDLIVS